MNLTEPQAGSDVGAVRTRANRAEGHYRITGQKIFITYGDHDMTPNIVHLVLARLPDAPPGTKGISLFLVPKFLVRPDGSLGERNDVRTVSLEHKLGIHASPTAVLAYGDNGGAMGFLVGEENRGMEYMFTMMNNARLNVGLQGVAIGERAYQQARDFARIRVQGKPLTGSSKDGPLPIIHHPDVRRMLLGMKAQTEASRALAYYVAATLDRSRHDPDDDTRAAQQAQVDLLIPVVKAWSTDLGCEIASTGVQIHGGMGFIEETGAAQHYRDARITPIYEGTNGIQGMDLIGRKVVRDGGRAAKAFIATMRELDPVLAERPGDDIAVIRAALAQGIDPSDRVADRFMGRGSRGNGRRFRTLSPAVRHGRGRLAHGQIRGRCSDRAWSRGNRRPVQRSQTDHRPVLRRAIPPERCGSAPSHRRRPHGDGVRSRSLLKRRAGQALEAGQQDEVLLFHADRLGMAAEHWIGDLGGEPADRPATGGDAEERKCRMHHAGGTARYHGGAGRCGKPHVLEITFADRGRMLGKQALQHRPLPRCSQMRRPQLGMEGAPLSIGPPRDERAFALRRYGCAMPRHMPVGLVLLLAGCSTGSPTGPPTHADYIVSPAGAYLQVVINDPNPVQKVRLVSPAGDVTYATRINAGRSAYSSFAGGPGVLGLSIGGFGFGHGGGGGGSLSLSGPAGGGEPDFHVITTASIPLTDINAYHENWRNYRIEVELGTQMPQFLTLTAPQPPA
jgi:alkylation response protein AidB-like acyl-CoA dehydrogenase